MDSQSLFILVFSAGIIGLVIVGVLVYTGKITNPTALKIAGGLATVLGAMAVGLAAGRRRGEPGRIVPPPPLPPEPTAPDVARSIIAEGVRERVGVIEGAETDPDELERLRRLSET